MPRVRSILAAAFKLNQTVAASVLLTVSAGCATAPPAPPARIVPYEEKVSWILRLEDRRVLRDAEEPPPPAVTPPRRRASVPPPKPSARPDLSLLVADPEARVRRRAALAIGRVGLPAGVSALTTAIADADPQVRQMAAFALGLIGDRAASEALLQALADPVPIVRGRAAEALGLIGDATAAARIGEVASAAFRDGALAGLDPDDERQPSDMAETFRLAIYALVRLKAYEPLAAAVLTIAGEPVSRWWPIAYALQRIEDQRARPALLALARGPGRYSVAFAARGLGNLREPAAVDLLLPLVDASRLDPLTAPAAIRALGRIGDERAASPLITLLQTEKVDPNIQLEAVDALAALKPRSALDLLLDLIADPWPAMRAAALRAIAAIDSEQFTLVVSGMDPDPHWSVRAALATALGGLDPEVAAPSLEAMLKDSERRPVPAVLSALARVKAPQVDKILLRHLSDGDPIIRMAAAREIGERRPADGARALADAYRFGAGDPTYVARAAALDAVAKYGAETALELLKTALSDKDWAVRLKAAALLEKLDPSGKYDDAIRPAPGVPSIDVYAAPEILSPKFSSHIYIETAKGTVQVELSVVDAPLTAWNFLSLARKGFFNRVAIHRVVPNFVVQDGDPRGDGEGGPGYTIRDELNQLPYLRGTVGMALDWRDTGGSQFFITHSPQPHLDARYTVFGRVVAGMEVVDRLQQWDRIDRVRVWDGQTLTKR